ncbi:hypothetical protein SAMN05216268_101257 [Streptomyces yunnanensis]|uniref:Uncharacterized protein n=1 Tax=Streptomyces yunnanensis TaxID=156453 RepID=A0A9X8MIW5_9ACTN|nr:hypothetical protein SAMN05216268_101257 [Streptomyces yunnanensis]
MARLSVLKVRGGDMVCVGGRWREVKGVRSGVRSSGRPLVVMTFKEGPSLRFDAGEELAVCRDGRGRR